MARLLIPLPLSLLSVIGLLTILTFCAQTNGIGTIVPLYLYPEVVNGRHNWQPLIDSASTHRAVDVWAIVNPGSGPGGASDPSYVDAINRLKAANIHTLGYVSTDYSNRDISLVRADIATWKSLYSPNGIFFDEMKYDECQPSGSTFCFQYYASLDSYAKSLNFTFTVGNPGTDILPEYALALDTVMIYETNSGFPNQSYYAGWHDAYPRWKWGIFPYNLLTLDSNAVQDAKQHVGFIYATDDVLPNPWDQLPAYLDQMLDMLT